MKVTMMTRAGQMPSALEQIGVAHHEIVAHRLQDRDRHGGVPGDGLDLLAAFLAAVPGQPLQRGNGHSQQLDDDGAVDIGLDAQGKHRGVGKSAAAHHVVKTQDGRAHLIEIGGQQIRVHIRNRDGVADAKNQKDEECKDDLLPQLGDAPRFANRLDHVTSPRPFRQLPRLPPWQKRRKQKL